MHYMLNNRMHIYPLDLYQLCLNLCSIRFRALDPQQTSDRVSQLKQQALAEVCRRSGMKLAGSRRGAFTFNDAHSLIPH